MRTYLRSLLLLIGTTLALFGVTGCQKSNHSDSKGCITRQVWKVSDVVMRQSDYDTAVMLFQANRISLIDNQPIQQFTNGTDSGGGILRTILVRQYFNYLPVAAAINSFSFDNGQFLQMPYQLTGLLQTRDTSASIGVDSLRKIFLHSNPDHYPVNNMSQRRASHWADSCLVAVLSNVYQSAIEPATNTPDSLGKVWAIYGLSNQNAPIAYISDPGVKVFPVAPPYFWP